MQKSNIKNATAAEKQAAIEEILKENPNASRREITELTGIPDSTVWHIQQRIANDDVSSILLDPKTFDSEAEFENFIKYEPHHVFGDEEIDWETSPEERKALLPGAENNIFPDWIGTDSNGNVVIVDMKVLSGNTVRDRNEVLRSVGQMLDYATGYARKHTSSNIEDLSDPSLRDVGKSTRLYIVVHPVISPTLEDICQLLRANGINIYQRVV